MTAPGVTCPRCGVTLPGRLHALDGGVVDAVVADHQKSVMCSTGTVAAVARAAGLLPMLHFETRLRFTFHKSMNIVANERAARLRAEGITVDTRMSAVARAHPARGPGKRGGPVTERVVTRKLTGEQNDTALFAPGPELWAPGWAVAVDFATAGTLSARYVLRAGQHDPEVRAAIDAMVRVVLPAAEVDSRADFVGAIRDFVEGVRA